MATSKYQSSYGFSRRQRRPRRRSIIASYWSGLGLSFQPWVAFFQGKGGLPWPNGSMRDKERVNRKRQRALAEMAQRLKEAREYRHLSLAAVSLATKISQKNLAALEAADLRALPGRAYTRAFLRTYAAYLGLDGEEMSKLLPAPPERAPKVYETRREYTGPSATFLIMFSAVLGLVACVGWVALQAAMRPAAMVAGPSVLDAPTAETTAGVLDVQPPTPSPTATPALTLMVHASQPLSVTITIDGSQVFSGTLAAGDNKTFGGAATARLRTNNAAFAEVTYNGEKLKPLGKPNETVEMEWVAGKKRPTPVPSGTAKPNVNATVTPTVTPPPPPPVSTGERPR